MPGFLTLNYGGSTPSTTLTFDMTAASDQEISQRNGHYILSEDYRLLAVAAYGNNLLRASIQSPTINSVAPLSIWGVNDSTISLSPPRIEFWRRYMPPMPRNEEIQVSATVSGADTVTVTLFLASADWTPQLPQGITPVPIFETRVTCVPTMTNQSWGAPTAITFSQNLRGGTYAVVGAAFQGTGVINSRFIFPRARFYQGRRLRPGMIASQAIGDELMTTGLEGPFWAGEFGRFSTFEPPQMEFYGFGSTTINVEGRLYLVRLSEDMNVTYPGQGA